MQEHSDKPDSLLRNRGFILLWCAYGISAFGDHFSEMAILRTQNALGDDVDVTPMMARMSFLLFLPFFLFGPINGLIADLLPRRAVMIAADVARAGVMFVFMSLLAFTTGWGSWGPFLPILVIGIFAALFSPARQAMVPALVPAKRLVPANGMIAGLGVIATMFGVLLGGHFAGRADVNVRSIFWTDAGTYLVSALLVFFIPRTPAPSGERTLNSEISGLARGVKYVLAHRRVVLLLVVASITWFCGAMVRTVIPAVVRDVYGGGYEDFGKYQAYLAVGMIAGALTITWPARRIRSDVMITWGLFGIAASMVVFALSVFLPLAPRSLSWVGGVGIVGGGYFGACMMASFNAMLQHIVPDCFRGRVFGVKDLCTSGSLLLATGALGLPDWTGIDGWVGFILLAVAGIMFAAGCGSFLVHMRARRRPFLTVFFEHIGELMLKGLHRMETLNRPTVPPFGATLVTANHRCAADPLLLISSANYRLIGFLVAAEYTRSRFLNVVLQTVNCIPVQRDGRDAAGTRAAIRHLETGKALGIFIEGGIRLPGERLAPKNGVAMIALRTGIKVVPAYISGVKNTRNVLKGILWPHKARVRWGPAVDLSEFADREDRKAALTEATHKIYRAVIALAPPEEQADMLRRWQSREVESDLPDVAKEEVS